IATLAVGRCAWRIPLQMRIDQSQETAVVCAQHHQCEVACIGLCACAIAIHQRVDRTPCQGTLAYECRTPVWLPSSLLGKVSRIPERPQGLLHCGKSLVLDFLQADYVRTQSHNMAHERWLPPGAGQYRLWGPWIPRRRDIGLRQDIVRGQ